MKRFTFWAPRILIIVFALFLAIFSLDVFDSADTAGQIALGLFMHNIPSFVLLIVLAISWRRDRLGGVIFLALGTACLIGLIFSLPMGSKLNPILVIGGVVFLLIGSLFMKEPLRKARRKKLIISLAVCALVILASVAAIIYIRTSRTECSAFSLDKCPKRCVVCPPCEVCSSISCQTEEFCRGMGFDREWYMAIEEKLESQAQ